MSERRSPYARVVLSVTVLGMSTSIQASSAAATPIAVTPPGMTVVMEDAAWSWFEDRRVSFDAAGETLYASAVAGRTSTAQASGSVLLTELDLASGSRRMVNLGVGPADDHNSASIWVAPDGEVTTSWSRHNQTAMLHTHRRRTDGSWLALQPIPTSGKTTYSNLISAGQDDGSDLLYDFFRGERFDPEVLMSTDVGRTWASLGRLLRDPQDDPATRPYVQYRATSADRIDFIATEGHPDAQQTSVYHGFIEDGRVHTSAGTSLGTLGSAVPVTALTRVWAPRGTERGWTADLVTDPVTGILHVAFSVRHSATDHRFWVAQWTGASWLADEVAFAGTALYPGQPSYTGLLAIDPADPDHLVISTDVDPATGTTPAPGPDGQVHFELWDGTRQPNGTIAWLPLTSGSTVDNIRPVMARHGNGSSALLWMRGTYTSFTNYDLDVVGIVRRPGGSTVSASPSATPTKVRSVLAPTTPQPAAAQPVIGRFDAHGVDDVLLYRPGAPGEQLLLGDDQRHPTPVASSQVNGTYTPIPGDYDADGTTDIYWYAPGPATDHLWTANTNGTFTSTPPRQVNGTYTPIPGDYDADGTTDIYWYAPGPATDHLWTANTNGTFTSTPPRQVNGTYTPIPGDYDADGTTDIYWYAPGPATDHLWTANTNGTFTSTPPRQVNGTYTPIPGDYDADGTTDIYWYAPGPATDHLWTANTNGTFTSTPPRQVNGTYTPIPGDHDGDGTTDIYWYAPGPATDYLWWSTAGPLAASEPAALNL